MTTRPLDKPIADEELTAAVAGWASSESESVKQAAHTAFARLYDRHARGLLAFLATRVGKTDSQEVFQEVWLHVWQALPDQFQGGNFRAWLYRIARNAAIDHQRRQRPELMGEAIDLPDHQQDPPEKRLEDQERLAIFQRCLQRLTPMAANVFRARLGGEAYPELCHRLGLEANRAYKLFSEAKAQLQQCVQRAKQ